MRPRKYNGDPNEHGDLDETTSKSKKSVQVREAQHSNVLTAHGSDPPKERNDDDDARGEKRKKRKRDPTSPSTVVDVPSAAHEEKSKKRKNKKRRSHDNTEEAPPRTFSSDGDENDFLSFDPSSDASLTEQNCKALSYAYQRFYSPSLWKFNKAKQNWLIRNIWSEQAIPDKYTPLVRQYLMGLKGAIRQTLTETCKSKMKPSDEAAPGAESQADSIQGSSSISTIDSRARSLLAALTESN